METPDFLRFTNTVGKKRLPPFHRFSQRWVRRLHGCMPSLATTSSHSPGNRAAAGNIAVSSSSGPCLKKPPFKDPSSSQNPCFFKTRSFSQNCFCRSVFIQNLCPLMRPRQFLETVLREKTDRSKSCSRDQDFSTRLQSTFFHEKKHC